MALMSVGPLGPHHGASQATLRWSPRRRFVPGQRDPLRLPADRIELPAPNPPDRQPPPPINPLSSLLPPILMLVASFILVSLTSAAWVTMLPMLLMSLAWPIANLVGQASQKRAYEQALRRREADYRQRIAEERRHLEELARRQRALLEKAYPSLNSLCEMALEGRKQMWARRPADDDFLSLRIGSSEGPASFTVEPPRYADRNDSLFILAQELAEAFRQTPDLPYLFHLGSIGSVALSGPSALVRGLARRLVLDLVVHHSPEDVSIGILADTHEAIENWSWLKWLPHTGSLECEKKVFPLAFGPTHVKQYLEFLRSEYTSRRGIGENVGGGTRRSAGEPAIVLLVDDCEVRHDPDIQRLAEVGYEVAIYLIFVGGRDWPRECRSRIDVLDTNRFRFVETWRKDGEVREGFYESALLTDCERVARKLAGWEVAGSRARAPLPESVRLSEVLGVGSISVEAVKDSWSKPFTPEDLLKFPIGLCARHDGLDLVVLNLLKTKFGGSDAFHTILIGTTGSGKSELMKSMVLGAAIRYPPYLLNFFFLDFKGGAAFNIFQDLPHVTGVVTNLSPELVERGLDSIKNEIERRQELFKEARVDEIWAYNEKHPDHPLAHLVLFLDEFTQGLADFPRLRDTLDVLVRQGRSLGMYLVLANQSVNPEVDKLLANVGWRIALKVGRPQEMSIIDRALRSPTRAGQGFLRSLTGDIVEFQAGYAGLPVRTTASFEEDVFTIFEVEADGNYRPVYRRRADAPRFEGQASVLTEEQYILQVLKQAAAELNIRPASRIYLDPLPPIISLEEVFSEASVEPSFRDGRWNQPQPVRHVVAYWGKVDIPEKRQQEVLQTDFDEKDGHLWLVGVQGSGRDMALAALLMSLALTHTPDQLHFYMVDLGAGELAPFEALPHTGAVISPGKGHPEENERLGRLLDLLGQEVEKRARSGRKETQTRVPHPAFFVVINSFAELWSNCQEEAERFIRFVRDGGRLGLHFIITTSQRHELIHSIASIVSRRLVLRLADKDDYIDLVGRPVAPLEETPGRGYWVDGEVVLCQTAQPPKVREIAREMHRAWKGRLPPPIEILPNCLPLGSWLKEVGAARRGGQVFIPVGEEYTTLEWVQLDLAQTSPFWQILGPRGSGKSNFLACAARSVLEQDTEEKWLVRAYALRRGPLVTLAEAQPRLFTLVAADDIIRDCQSLAEGLRSGAFQEERLLLLVDDLGQAFQPGREDLAKALNGLAETVESVGGATIIASGLLDELRLQLGSPIVKLLRQYRTGLVFSRDPGEVDWLGAQIPLEYRKKELPLGRGFFVHKNKIWLVQTPWLGEALGKEEASP